MRGINVKQSQQMGIHSCASSRPHSALRRESYSAHSMQSNRKCLHSILMSCMARIENLSARPKTLGHGKIVFSGFTTTSSKSTRCIFVLSPLNFVIISNIIIIWECCSLFWSNARSLSSSSRHMFSLANNSEHGGFAVADILIVTCFDAFKHMKCRHIVSFAISMALFSSPSRCEVWPSRNSSSNHVSIFSYVRWHQLATLQSSLLST